jgi:hypothetical protein
MASIAPLPSRILRQGEVGQLSGFSRSLQWKWAILDANFRLSIYQVKPDSNILPILVCSLEQTSMTWGYFEGSKEPVLRFCLKEAPLSTATSCGCGCFETGSKNEFTMVLHNDNELKIWIRAIQILFANSDHQPVQQGDGGSVGDECTICLSEFENDEVLLVLPCNHRFHQECITEWLTCSNKCPLCRENSLDTTGQPLVTPAKFRKH